jgi:hypothetical protein
MHAREYCSCLLLAVSLGAFSGCSDGKAAWPVRGKVTLTDGTPVAGATVSFEDKANRRNSSGSTDENGVYTLTTFEMNDGAPAGQYTVTVHPPQAQDSGQAQPKPVFDPRYSNASTSGLTRTVEAKDNTIDLTLDKAGAIKPRPGGK